MILTFDLTEMTSEQVKALWRAQSLLGEAGIRFDTGCALKDGNPITRDWQMEWSLSGPAEVTESAEAYGETSKGLCLKFQTEKMSEAQQDALTAACCSLVDAGVWFPTGVTFIKGEEVERIWDFSRNVDGPVICKPSPSDGD